jgi:Rrf2 family transcriptional regulator, iron-sulfur cluster assembly transcription factor
VKLTPTNRTDYAIRALIYLANQQGDGTADQAPAPHVKAADIGRAMGIPTGFLQQVLQELQRARLVRSRSGPAGGYVLGRDPADITILEIVETLEGPIAASECALRGGPCHWDDVCALHWVWSSARAALSDSLRAATLARVAADDRALATGSRPAPRDSHRRRDA